MFAQFWCHPSVWESFTTAHGIEEEESVWLSHQNTLEKFDDFLKNALMMDPDEIEEADIHRLPQTPQKRSEGQSPNYSEIILSYLFIYRIFN